MLLLLQSAGLTLTLPPSAFTQLLAVTCDNADNNSTMLDEMHRRVPSFGGRKARVRCFAHTLNLVVKVRIHY